VFPRGALKSHPDLVPAQAAHFMSETPFDLSPDERVSALIRYHERTKHRLERYAAALGYLDWDTQPDPFLRYDGAPRVLLAESTPDRSPGLDELDREGGLPARPLDAASLAQWLYDSLAISAWKSTGDHRWSLRCNPSSGNLHPTEAYLVLPEIDGLFASPGVHHYRPLDHALEMVRAIPATLAAPLFAGEPPGSFLVALTSIHWREAWKYGERAYRYCQHDVGHAVAALAYAAAALGWRLRRVAGVGDALLASALALPQEDETREPDPEAEHPDLLLRVSPADSPPRHASSAAAVAALAGLAGLPRMGVRNRLSSDHVPWVAIDEAAFVAASDGLAPLVELEGEAPPLPAREVPAPLGARAIFRSRRSAVAFDGATSMSRAAFLRLCSRLLPARGRVPFASLGTAPRIHPVFFVHRVDGLEPGIYALPRSVAGAELLRANLRADFAFTPVAPDLPLVLLAAGDAKRAAALVSCHQQIAADSAFAMAMLAEFEGVLAERSAAAYRELHHEAGALGQVLYLEAEAAAIRGTGIGCFFDDVLHSALGIRGRALATIYHFTVGGPVEDERLATLPAYQRAGKVGRAPSPSEECMSEEDKGGMSVERHGDDVRRSSCAPQPGECRPSFSTGC
jgi:SagB-type dehydrogenase family enzyme